MDQETANYIVTHFANLLTESEAKARRHMQSLEKLQDCDKEDPKWRLYLDKGWLTSDSNALELTNSGYEDFVINAAIRILTESADKVHLNKCPNCEKLARTPQARQCRHCGHNWHSIVTAKFDLIASFQLPDRLFYITGQIKEGEVNKGDRVDLTMIRLNCRPKIESIEYVLPKSENGGREDIALGNK